MINSQNKQGFTLVELAIVITIIGILIGGVLKGQQLIEQARIAGTIQQFTAYKSGVQIFQTTYDSIPGDMAKAAERIIDCAGCTATAFVGGAKLGDRYVGHCCGDGVRDTEGQNILGSENTMFWLQLYKANIISGVTDAALNGGPVAWGQTHPAAKVGGGFSVGEARGPQTSSWAGLDVPYATVIALHKDVDDDLIGASDSVLSVSTAASIDRKLDDGQPDGGDVRAIGATGGCFTSAAAPATEYLENTPGSNICTLTYSIIN